MGGSYLWTVCTTCFFGFISIYKIPILFSLLKFTASIFAGLVRIGISAEKIRQKQTESNIEFVQEFIKNKEKESGTEN